MLVGWTSGSSLRQLASACPSLSPGPGVGGKRLWAPRSAQARGSPSAMTVFPREQQAHFFLCRRAKGAKPGREPRPLRSACSCPGGCPCDTSRGLCPKSGVWESPSVPREGEDAFAPAAESSLFAPAHGEGRSRRPAETQLEPLQPGLEMAAAGLSLWAGASP